MKNASTAMLNFLLSTDVESIYKADLIEIQLIDGTVLFVTNGQVNITYAGNVYNATGLGQWDRGRVSTKLGVEGSTLDMTVTADDLTLVPNRPCSIIQGINLGLFDGATVTIRTAYMPTYGDTSLGVETKFVGQWGTATKIGRTSAEIECQSFLFLLNQQMPRVILQPACHWELYGPGCTLSAAPFTFSNVVGSSSTQSILNAGATISQASGYFTQGVIKFTSGNNLNLSTLIKVHAGQALTLSPALLFPVTVGDAFNLIAGCDHTLETCQAKFNNRINFGGQPFIPNPENAISV
jgi:uncharacterized phage protein (TIGR02218 family)